MADGTTFQVNIAADASQATTAATQLDQLSERLSGAGTAAAKAADDVKAGQAVYNASEQAANRAAKALERIGLAADAQKGKLAQAMATGDQGAIDRAQAKLAALTARQSEAAAKAAASKAALEGEAAALDRLKTSAAAADAEESKLAKAHDAAKKATADEEKAAKTAAAAAAKLAAAHGKEGEASEGVEVNYRKLGSALGKLGGPLGVAGQKGAETAEVFKKLGSSLGAAGPYVAIAVALAAIATGAALATAAMLKFGIATSDAARTQGLLDAGIARSVAGGAELDAKIGSLAKSLPQSREEITSMAAELSKAGLRGDALTSALERNATAAAKLKYGPEFEKATLSLDKQTEILHDNIAGLFGGLKIEGLLGSIQKIVALFDETSVTGKAIKGVFESLFQPLVDGVASIGPKIVSLFIQFEIWALKGLIAIKPYGSTFLFIGKIIGVAALAVGAALGAVIAVVVGMAAAAAVLVGGLTYLGVKFAGLVIQAVEFAAALIAQPGQAIDWLKAKFDEVVAFLSGISLGDIGKGMIDGLVQGITGAAGAILDAMTGAVKGAISGAKKLLGIASPSKVFAEIGTNTGAGMAEGVDDSTAKVQSSMEKLVEPPKVAAIPAPAAAEAPKASAAPSTPAAAAPSAPEKAAASPAAAAPAEAKVNAPSLSASLDDRTGAAAAPAPAAPSAPALAQVGQAAAATPAPAAPSAPAAAPSKGSGSSPNFAGATFTFNGVEGAEDAEARFAAMLTRILEGDSAQLGAEVPA